MYTLIIKSDNGSADRLIQSTVVEDFLPLDQIMNGKYAYGAASAILINMEGICLARWNTSVIFNIDKVNVPILPDSSQDENKPVTEDTDDTEQSDTTNNDPANILFNIINNWQDDKTKVKPDTYTTMLNAIKVMANIKQVKPENMADFIDSLFKPFMENPTDN